VRGLSGISADARGLISVPLPRAPPRSGRPGPGGDTLRTPADTTGPHRPPADSTRPATPAPRDTTRTPPPAALPSARDRTP
jgi:hypothetical protein